MLKKNSGQYYPGLLLVARLLVARPAAELSEKQLESWVLLILDGASNNISAMPKMKGGPFFPFACWSANVYTHARIQEK